MSGIEKLEELLNVKIESITLHPNNPLKSKYVINFNHKKIGDVACMLTPSQFSNQRRLAAKILGRAPTFMTFVPAKEWDNLFPMIIKEVKTIE